MAARQRVPATMRPALAIRGHQRRRAPQLCLVAAAWTGCVFSLATSAHSARAAAAAPPDPAAKHSAARPAQPKSSAYDAAARLRSQLEAVPEADRTRAQYAAVMDAFRSVYHNTPRDAKAPDSIYAVAQLLAEQGRVLGDARASQAAVGQYAFLRQQYPTTPLRISALLAEGQVEQSDLRDTAAAQSKFNELLKTYPRSAQADEARAALAGMGAQAPALAPTREQIAEAFQPPSRPSASASRGGANATEPPTARAPVATQAVPAAQNAPASAAAASDAHRAAYSGPLAQVTSIHHWSTASYTRVVVALGANIPYSSGRVANPDRIYFDLHDAHLARELAGKSIDVTDNGYLKRIRVAQYSADTTRVVLDVNDITDYSSFVLPDPYRLIIDIRSRAQVGSPTSLAANPPGSPTEAPLPADATVTAPPGTPAPNVSPSPVAAQSQPAPASATAATRADGMTMQNTGYARPPDTPINTSEDPAPTPAAATTAAPLPAAPQPTQAQRRATTRSNQLAGTAAPNATRATASLTVPPLPAAVPHPDAESESSPRKSKSAKSAKTGNSAKDAAPVIDDASPGHAAEISAAGERSLVRALGLKIGRIVIDAGHGGHDSGTIGPGGIEEKDVVLDVALRLGNLLRERLGADVTYTRDDDTFIPLEQRTAIANTAKADLFISIHANSSSEPNVRGVEVYYLNFTSQPDALEVAARENAVANGSIYELSDLVKKITLKDKLDESREFAADVDSSLYAGLQKGNSGMKDRGVKKAPFMVLIGANMPSILCEIGFITNPKDATLMRDPTYDQRVAESLYRGLAKYIGGLSGMRVAQAPISSPAKDSN